MGCPTKLKSPIYRTLLTKQLCPILSFFLFLPHSLFLSFNPFFSLWYSKIQPIQFLHSPLSLALSLYIYIYIYISSSSFSLSLFKPENADCTTSKFSFRKSIYTFSITALRPRRKQLLNREWLWWGQNSNSFTEDLSTCIYIYIYMLHLVRHKATKWFSDNQHCYNFHHTTSESTCDTLSSSAANQGDNILSVAQDGTATPGATKQLGVAVHCYNCTWFDTKPQSELVKTNTVIIYIYIYIYEVSVAVERMYVNNCNCDS